MVKSTRRRESRIVYAILAAQAAALRAEIANAVGAEIDFLSDMSDVVTRTVETMRDAANHSNALPPPLAERCLEAAAAAPGTALDAFAFAQAQRLDLVSQMAEFLVSALTRLADDGDRLKAVELSELYVSEGQRRIHHETLPLAEYSASNNE